MPSSSCSEKVAATFLCPRSCGFARVAALVLGRQVFAKLVKEEKVVRQNFVRVNFKSTTKDTLNSSKIKKTHFKSTSQNFARKSPN